MERQSTSKLFRALIAVVAFFVLCTSAILFASCGTDPKECDHDTDGKLLAVTKETCGTAGTLTYECSKCGAEVTVTGTLATGNHDWADGKCKVCGIAQVKDDELTLKDVKDALTESLTAISNKVTESSTAVEGLVSKIVAALKSDDFTIPSLKAQLEEIKNALDALDFDFDIGGIELVSEEGNTLGEVISSLYKQVNALYTDYASKMGNHTVDDLYALFVGGEGETAHVHNWVLELEGEYSCTEPNTYVWGCSFCDETKGDKVTVMATGHATEFKSGLEDAAHHFDATCISPARVEGYCANCEEWTGEWTEVGQPTYQHKYVLEDGTLANGTAGTAGSCTSVHEFVYHCETCGGAYVVENPNAKTEHNYYCTVDENGVKTPLTDTAKKEIVKDYYGLTGADSEEKYNALTEAEKGLALQPYLNTVYAAEATCVDPALVVVECVECGVRYSYSYGEPTGHAFVVAEGTDPDCTAAGIATYSYCTKCHYYFLGDGNAAEAEDQGNATQYSRKYMKYTGEDGNSRVLTGIYTGTGECTTPPDNDFVHQIVTAEKPALGHKYVVVYTNVPKCVTAQRYVLVCERCFEQDGKSFAEHVSTETAVDEDALFFNSGTAEAPVYWLNGLTGDPTHDTTLANSAIAKILAAKAEDGDCDLTNEWKKIETLTNPAEILAWLEKKGYLVRDAKDDETFNDKTAVELKNNVYNPYNVVLTDGTDLTVTEFVNPVVGHKFTEQFVTVISGCTLYERHVYFCSECGQSTGVSSLGEAPYVVTGDTDTYCAGYKTTAPDGFKTDLELEWETVKANPDTQAVFAWLAQHGYLNEYCSDPTLVYSADDDDVNEAFNEIMLNLALKLYPTNEAMSEFFAQGNCFKAEELEPFFTGKNVLDEFTVDAEYVEDEDAWFDVSLVPVTLGHHFDKVAYVGVGENCDEPAKYVYVCSVCGTSVTGNALEYWSGEETVTTKATLVNTVTYATDESVFNASVPEARRGTGKDFETDDLAAEFAKLTTEDEKFDWLLEKGYLNGVIDSYMLYGYVKQDNSHVKGLLEAKAEEEPEAELQDLYDEVYATVYGEDGKLLSDKKEAVKTAAKDLVTTLDELYTKSGNGESTTDGKAANKTSGVAAVTIPESGHVWYDAEGNVMTLGVSPQCYEFKDETLTQAFKDGKLAWWDSSKGEWAFSAANEFTYDDLPEEIKTRVEAYGVVGVCYRQTCPLKATTPTAESEHPYGYVLGVDHVTSYEKYKASANTGYPTKDLETVNDGEHVYYNYNTVSNYNNEETAATYLTGVAWKDASDEQKSAAAQAAMDADLHNLTTLQKIWNSLFVPATWRNTDALKAAYPYLDSVMKADNTVDFDAVKALFDADGTVPYLWTNDKLGKRVSAWRPLSDELDTNGRNIPSCWVGLYCKWYHYEGGNVCTKGYPEVRHTYPTNTAWFGQESHVANCQHLDLCMTCGQPIGTSGNHNLYTITKSITNEDYQAAWIEVLKAAYNYTASATAPTAEQAFLAKVKAAVEFTDETPDFTAADFWTNGWKILEDTCHLAGQEGSEAGYTIQVCTGELEVIAINLQESKEWNDGITWSENANYKVTKIDEKAHGEWQLRYYYLNDYYVDGELVAAKNTVIPADTHFDENAFSDIICQVGYYTREHCQQLRQDGTVCDCVNPATDGLTVADYSHAPAGHTLAPVVNYWQLNETYRAPSGDQNATMDQVCVVCGMHFNGVWAQNTAGDDRAQFNLATVPQIDAWNAHVDATTDQEGLWKAQPVRTEDVATGETGNTVTGSLASGLHTYKNDAELSLGSADNGTVTVPGDTSMIVGKGKRLTFNKASGATAADLVVTGKLAIVGDDKTAKVAFTEVTSVTVDGGQLTLRNLEVDLSSTYINPKNGAKVVFENVTVTGGTPVLMNAHDAVEGKTEELVITSSTFVSESDVALAIFKKSVHLTAEDSTFAGKWAGALVRGGAAEFTGCKFITEAGQKYSAQETWQSGTDVPVSAGLIVGNATAVETYGDADVTLTDCTFALQTITEFKAGLATVDATVNDQENPAIAVYSSAKNSTTLTLDSDTLFAATVISSHGGVDEDGASTLTTNFGTVTTENLGTQPAEQAQNAAKLVESLAALGGDVTLPKLTQEIVLDSYLVVPVGASFTCDLGGNTVVESGIFAQKGSTVTLSNGTLSSSAKTRSTGAQLINVMSDAIVVLNGVTIEAEDENAYGLSIFKNGDEEVTANVTVTNCTFNMPNGTPFYVNGTADGATVTLTNSYFLGGKLGAWIAGECEELEATNCYFAGRFAGAAVFSGNASFTGCSFLAGEAYFGSSYEDAENGAFQCFVSSGNGIAGSSCAALVIAAKGGGYGENVVVEVKQCNYLFAQGTGALFTENGTETFGASTLKYTPRPADATEPTDEGFDKSTFKEAVSLTSVGTAKVTFKTDAAVELQWGVNVWLHKALCEGSAREDQREENQSAAAANGRITVTGATVAAAPVTVPEDEEITVTKTEFYNGNHVALTMSTEELNHVITSAYCKVNDVRTGGWDNKGYLQDGNNKVQVMLNENYVNGHTYAVVWYNAQDQAIAHVTVTYTEA